MRRWAGAGDRLNADDKLIDYWVGLESIFASDSNQEVRFRAPLRIAGLLGTTSAERQQIYDDMRHSYDWRSALVHGADNNRVASLARKMDLDSTSARTRAVLRTTLLQMLESEEAIDPTTVEKKLLEESKTPFPSVAWR